MIPSIAFRHTTRRLGGINLGSSSVSTSLPDLQAKVVNMESQLQALYAYIAMKEGGIPEELAGVFPCHPLQVQYGDFLFKMLLINCH